MGYGYVDKDVNYEVNVNIDDSFNWDVDRIVSDEVRRCNNGRVKSDVGAEVGCNDGKGV